MRTLDLIKALTEPEIKEIEILLRFGKRANLLLLFKELRKYINKSAEPETKSLFQKVFRKKYSKQQDHLLRNKLSRLNEILYKFLATATFTKSISNNQSTFNVWLAKCYSERNLRPLFKADIDEFIAHAKSKILYDDVNALNEMRTMLEVNKRETHPTEISQQLQNVLQWQQDEKRRFIYQIYKTETLQSVLEYNRGLMLKKLPEEDDWSSGIIFTYDFTEIIEGDWYAEYAALKKRIYQSKGNGLIKYLDRMLEIEERPEAKAVLSVLNLANTRGRLATELMLQDRFNEANVYYDQCVELCIQHKVPVNPAHISNYIVSLLYAGQYEKVIEVYKAHETVIDSSLQKQTVQLNYSYACLFINRVDEAISLQSEIQLLSLPDKYLSRVVYLIGFIMRKQYKLALNELSNLKRMLLRQEDNTHWESHLLVFDWYGIFLKAQVKGKVEREKMLAELKLKIEHEGKNRKFNLTSIIEWIWLKRELEYK